MNHKSISNVIKRGLTFLLAFAMIATSLYVAPAASAEELDGDTEEVILDESSSEVVEEEIIGEGEAEDADKLSNPTNEEHGQKDAFFLLKKATATEADFKIAYDEAATMATALENLVKNGTGKIKFGQYDDKVDEKEKDSNSTQKTYDSSFKGGNDTTSQYILKVVKIGDTEITDSVNVRAAFAKMTAVPESGKVTVKLKMQEAANDYTWENGLTDVPGAELDLDVAIAYNTKSLKFATGSATTYTKLAITGDETTLSKALVAAMITPAKASAAGGAPVKVDVYGSEGKWDTTYDGSTAEKTLKDISTATVSGDEVGIKITSVQVAGEDKIENTANGNTGVSDRINNMRSGQTAVVGFLVDTNQSSESTWTSVGRKAQLAGTVNITVANSAVSLGLTGPTTAEVEAAARAGMNTELAEALTTGTDKVMVQPYEESNGSVVTKGSPVAAYLAAANTVDIKTQADLTKYGLSAGAADGEAKSLYILSVADATDLTSLNANSESKVAEYEVVERVATWNNNDDKWTLAGAGSGAAKATGYVKVSAKAVAGTLKVVNDVEEVSAQIGADEIETYKNIKDAIIDSDNGIKVGAGADYSEVSSIKIGASDEITADTGGGSKDDIYVEITKLKGDWESAAELTKAEDIKGNTGLKHANAVAGAKLTVEYDVIKLAADRKVPAAGDATLYLKTSGKITVKLTAKDGTYSVDEAVKQVKMAKTGTTFTAKAAAKAIADAINGKVKAVNVKENETIAANAIAPVVSDAADVAAEGKHWVVSVGANEVGYINGVTINGTPKRVTYADGNGDTQDQIKYTLTLETATQQSNGTYTLSTGGTTTFDSNISIVLTPQVGYVKSASLSSGIYAAKQDKKGLEELKAITDEIGSKLTAEVFKADGTTETIGADSFFYEWAIAETSATDSTLKATAQTVPASGEAGGMYYKWEITSICGQTVAANTSAANLAKKIATTNGTDIKIKLTPVVIKKNENGVISADNTKDKPAQSDELTITKSASGSTPARKLYIYDNYMLKTDGDAVINIPKGIELNDKVYKLFKANVETYKGYDADDKATYAGKADARWATDAELTAVADATEGSIVWQLVLSKALETVKEGTGDAAKNVLKAKRYEEVTISAIPWYGTSEKKLTRTPPTDFISGNLADKAGLDGTAIKYTVNVLEGGDLATVEVAVNSNNLFTTISGDGTAADMTDEVYKALEGKITVYEMNEDGVSEKVTAPLEAKADHDAADHDKTSGEHYVYELKNFTSPAKNKNYTDTYVEVVKYVYGETPATYKAQSAAFEINIGDLDGTLAADKAQDTLSNVGLRNSYYTINYTSNKDIANQIYDKLVGRDYLYSMDGNPTGKKAGLGTVAAGDALAKGTVALNLKSLKIKGTEYSADNAADIGKKLGARYDQDKTTTSGDIVLVIESFIGNADGEAVKVGTDLTYKPIFTIKAAKDCDVTLKVWRDASMTGQPAVQTEGTVERGKIIGKVLPEWGVSKYPVEKWYINGTKNVFDIENTPVSESITLNGIMLNTASSVTTGYTVSGVPNIVYNGKAYKPVPTVYDADGNVVAKSKLKLEYFKSDGTKAPSPKAPDSYYVMASTKGNSGVEVCKVPFVIEKIAVANGTTAAAPKVVNYNAKTKKATLGAIGSLKVNGVKMTYNKDYTYTVAGGTARMLDKGKMEFTAPGIYTITFTISEGSANFISGRTLTMKVHVAESKDQLKNASVKCAKDCTIDDEISYSYLPFTLQMKGTKEVLTCAGGSSTSGVYNSEGTRVADAVYNAPKGIGNPGKVTVTVTGTNGAYPGVKTFSYSLKAAKGNYKLKAAMIKGSSLETILKANKSTIAYTGNEWTLEDIVRKDVAEGASRLTMEEAIELISDSVGGANGPVYNRDFTIYYKNNIKAGKATATVTALRDSIYTGSFNITFNIQKVNVKNSFGTADEPGRLAWSSAAAADATAAPTITVVDNKFVDYKDAYATGTAAAADLFKYVAPAKNLIDSGDCTYTVKAQRDGSYKVTIKGKGSYTGTYTDKIPAPAK